MLNKKQLIDDTCLIFENHFKNKPSVLSLAPGRINIIGEHTDYNEGLAIPAAINRWVCTSIAISTSSFSSVYCTNYNEEITFPLSPSHKKTNWIKLVDTILLFLKDKYRCKQKFNMVINGNIPIGCGLSSSTAFVISIVNAICAISSINIEDQEKILLCQDIENSALNNPGGLLDQYTILMSKKDQLMMIDFEKKSFEYFTINQDEYSWIVVNSHKQRELSDTPYGIRVDECERGFELIKKISDINKFKDINTVMVENIRYSHPNLFKRLKHVITENKRVKSMRHALMSMNNEQIGSLLSLSHMSLVNDYEVSCFEIETLMDIASRRNGWIGGRMIGGGFGGCTLHYVHKKNCNEFLDILKQEYEKKIKIIPEIFEVAFKGGAFTKSLS